MTLFSESVGILSFGLDSLFLLLDPMPTAAHAIVGMTGTT